MGQTRFLVAVSAPVCIAIVGLLVAVFYSEKTRRHKEREILANAQVVKLVESSEAYRQSGQMDAALRVAEEACAIEYATNRNLATGVRQQIQNRIDQDNAARSVGDGNGATKSRGLRSQN